MRARHVRASAPAPMPTIPPDSGGLDPGRGRTKRLADYEGGGERREPLCIDGAASSFPISYSPDRKAERAHALLKGCRGHLHADAYAGFAGLYEADPLMGATAPLTEVACWAHARRKIYDIHVETKSPRGGAGARNDRAAVCDRS